MLTPLEKLRLRIAQRDYGPIATSAEALQLALEAETMCRTINPFDPAWKHFRGEQSAYERLAELLEKQENAGLQANLAQASA